MRELSSKLGGASMTRAIRTQAMKHHGALYSALAAHVLEEYDDRACTITEEYEKQVSDQIQFLESSLELHRQRVEREVADGRVLSKASNRRFSHDELDRLADIYNSSLYPRSEVVSALEQLAKPSEAPLQYLMRVFQKHEARAPASAELEPWIKGFCRTRDYIQGVAFGFSHEDGAGFWVYTHARSVNLRHGSFALAGTWSR